MFRDNSSVRGVGEGEGGQWCGVGFHCGTGLQRYLYNVLVLSYQLLTVDEETTTTTTTLLPEQKTIRQNDNYVLRLDVIKCRTNLSLVSSGKDKREISVQSTHVFLLSIEKSIQFLRLVLCNYKSTIVKHS